MDSDREADLAAIMDDLSSRLERAEREIEALEKLRAHQGLHCFAGYLEEGDLNGPNTAECCAIVLKLLKAGVWLTRSRW